MGYPTLMDFSFATDDVRRQVKRETLKRRLKQSGYRYNLIGQDPSTPPPKAPRTRKSRASPASTPRSHPSLSTPSSEAQPSSSELEPIYVGADCVGLGSEAFALAQLGLAHRVVYSFASESDAKTRATFETNHPECLQVFNTCCSNSRHVMGLPRVDHYVAGPPCGSWSMVGKRKGIHDTGGVDGSNRGSVFIDCILYINKHKKPTTFIIEEVPGIRN